MNYLKYDLGYQQKGVVVQVNLSGDACNVILLDDNNYFEYKQGRSYNYYGGHATQSPVTLRIPYSGLWYVVIDHGGYEGHTTASVSLR